MVYQSAIFSDYVLIIGLVIAIYTAVASFTGRTTFSKLVVKASEYWPALVMVWALFLFYYLPEGPTVSWWIAGLLTGHWFGVRISDPEAVIDNRYAGIALMSGGVLFSFLSLPFEVNVGLLLVGYIASEALWPKPQINR